MSDICVKVKPGIILKAVDYRDIGYISLYKAAIESNTTDKLARTVVGISRTNSGCICVYFNNGQWYLNCHSFVKFNTGFIADGGTAAHWDDNGNDAGYHTKEYEKLWNDLCQLVTCGGIGETLPEPENGEELFF